MISETETALLLLRNNLIDEIYNNEHITIYNIIKIIDIFLPKYGENPEIDKILEQQCYDMGDYE